MVFTHVTKNEILGIILLMEQQFIKLIQKTKAQKEQKDPLFKTFEGALFGQSSWFFHFQDQLIPVVREALTIVVSPAIVIDSIYLSEVLFVGDSFKGEGDDLLGKMITAMKLSGAEFHRVKMDEELESVTDLARNLESPNAATKMLFDIILEKRPKVVVSLGATVTNIFLGRREKLSTIHGSFIDKHLGSDCHYSLMPLFHPDFLLINPNMKRTAWIDLQKVMEYVGKI